MSTTKSKGKNKSKSNGAAELHPDLGQVVAPQKRTVIRKLLITAFHPTTPDTEAENAFRHARRLIKKEKLDPTEIMRPDWGAGPLVACLQRVGTVQMRTGKHSGKTLAYIVSEDPEWICFMASTGGLAAGPRHDALMAVYKAYCEELICRNTGDWSDFNLDDWGEEIVPTKHA